MNSGKKQRPNGKRKDTSVEEGAIPPNRDDQSTADRIVDLGREGYRFGRSLTNEVFAVDKNGPNIALTLKGSADALRSTLAKRHRDRHRKTPHGGALTDAISVLTGDALEAEPEAVHLRVADHGDSIVIDLGRADGQAVVVSASGWEVVARSPVLFRRSELTGVLPLPQTGGSLDGLRRFLNVTDDGWLLMRGWLVAALFPSIAHPILMLGGTQGAGKSTTMRLLLGLIDPSPAHSRSGPCSEEQWAMMAYGSWAIGLDNISRIDPWFSDALCKAVTGDGFVKRTHFTESGLTVLAYSRVVGITSIDAGALRGDLADRALAIELEEIDDRQRRSERELLSEYDRLRPALFGALLDDAAAVLELLPTIALDRMPRMADFAKVLKALDDLDESDNEGLGVYLTQGQRLAAEVIDGDPVALAIVSLVEQRGEWTGTATQLIEAIRASLPRSDVPKTPQAIAGRLSRLTPALKARGISVAHYRESDAKRTRKWTIRLVDRDNVQNVRNVHPSDSDSDGLDIPDALDDLDVSDDLTDDLSADG